MPGILGKRPDESSSHGLTGGFQYSAGQCDSAKRFKNGGLAQMCAEGAHEEDQERKCQREQGAAKLLGPAVSRIERDDILPAGIRTGRIADDFDCRPSYTEDSGHQSSQRSASTPIAKHACKDAVLNLVVPQGCRKPMPGTCPAIKLGA